MNINIRFFLLILVSLTSKSYADSLTPENEIIKETIEAIDLCNHMRGEVGDGDPERREEIIENTNTDCDKAENKAKIAFKKYPQNENLAISLMSFIDVLNFTDTEKKQLCKLAFDHYQKGFLKSKEVDYEYKLNCPEQASRIYR